MKIKIHQINMDLDRHRIKFDSYDSALKRAGRIDPSIYKTVFDGDVDCGNLEEIYEKFNIDHPVTHFLPPSSVFQFRQGASLPRRSPRWS